VSVTNTSDGQKIMSAWALWVSIALLILLIIMVLWGYKKDERDFINYKEISSDKHKIYMNLCLDPIESLNKIEDNEGE
jgi:hypothetical protein